MRKPHFLLLLAALGFSAGIHAQITVTNTTFPIVGDAFQVNIDVNPAISGFFTPPGGNQTWDFSALQTDLTSTTSFVHPSGGTKFSNFPGADLLVFGMGRELYYNVTNNAVEFLGFFGSDPVGIGINLLVPYNPPVVERRAPVNFFDINQVSSGVLVPFHRDDFPANLLQQLPFTADSFRIRIATNRLDAVDAWGNLSIPGGCYEVLREKRTTYEEKRLDAKIPPLGWLDVTDVAIQSLGLTALGVDTTTEFHFISNIDKQEIAIVRLNNAQSATEMIQFKNVSNVQLAISNISTVPETCPNANNGSMTITATGAGTLTYAISGPANQSNGTGVFTGLPDGSYTITVTSSNSPCPVSATATVAVGVDAMPPTITCPATQTLLLDANCTATLPNYTGMATTGDNCGVQGVTQSPTAGTPVSNGGNMTVTLTVMDVNGLSNFCTFTVTKVGSTPPTVVCKNTTVVLGSAGTYTLQPADVFDATASSGSCSGALTVTNISPAMVTCAQVNQTIPVVVTVQYGNGNTATCTAQVTVQEGATQPAGWNSANVGNANGTAGYTTCLFNGAFTVSATGFSTASSDVLHLTSQQLCGNGEIIARVATVTGGGWGGVMIRENLMPGAKKVALKTQLNNVIRREIRSITNGAAAMLNFNRPQHVWLRLTRNGSTFVGYTSTNGATWSFAFAATVSMTGCVHAGIFSESINVATTTTATFSNVSVTGAGTNLAAGLPNSELPSENGEQVRVFPNPTTGEVTIDLDIYAGKPGSIQIFNALGALTAQERLIPGNPETHRLRIGDLAGVYTVVIQLEDRRIVRRVVVNPNGGK